MTTTTKLAYLLQKADAALAAGHHNHALWLCGRARAVVGEAALDVHAAAAVEQRLQRLESACRQSLT